MATARARKTGAQWIGRAQELAIARHLDGAAHWEGVTELGFEKWSVPSRSGGDDHVVLTHSDLEHPACDCVSGQYGVPCSHAGTVALVMAMRRRIHDDPFRTFVACGEW